MVTRQDRINWLIARPRLWQGWPQVGWRASDEFIQRRTYILAKMRLAGLISAKTLHCDVNLYNLITDARKQIRGRKQ